MPTAKETGRRERSRVWVMLRNPAYKGMACFGQTRIAPCMHVTRILRLRGGAAARNGANHELPRTDWIEILVPTIISEETFALANEFLETNKEHPRDARSRCATCKDC
ncbi:recombinase family protein [Bradyrhizobium macuxiense]|uniref:recombinase family protein n=1 Tax=Bradyrhizobium macuxiense TaxID=1755647 RepID=UPI001919CAF2|nr:recombinase family protein [Bradyrhizobium macuxiense]